MVANIFQRIFRLLILLMVTLLVLLATYVSAGRLLMPAVSNYASFVEEQIFNLAGLPVSIESRTGDFDVFNPSLRINGLQLLVGRGQNQSLFEDTSALILTVRQLSSIYHAAYGRDAGYLPGLSLKL